MRRMWGRLEGRETEERRQEVGQGRISEEGKLAREDGVVGKERERGDGVVTRRVGGEQMGRRRGSTKGGEEPVAAG
eukprot:745959-Hanusia_phi.AAC.5